MTPIVSRDGRPFGAGQGNRMRSAGWLLPSVVAGSLRSTIGKAAQRDYLNPCWLRYYEAVRVGCCELRLEAHMSVSELLEEKREEILAIARRHGTRDVRVFGSAARGEAHEDSDIDFLVTAGAETSPWFPVGGVQELRALLARDVDVVTEQSLYWLIRRRILKEAKPL